MEPEISERQEIAEGQSGDGTPEGEVELLIEDEYGTDTGQSEDVTDGTPGDETPEGQSGQDDTDDAGGGSDEGDGESVGLKYDPDENLDRKFVIKHDGELIETDLRELKELAQKGLDFTKKTMALSSYRRMIEELEAMGVDSPQKLREMLAGETADIPGGSDTERQNPRDGYVPEVERVAEAILSQPDGEEFGGFVRKLPDPARQALAQNPRALSGLYTDFRNGIAPKLYGEVVKTMAMRPDLDFFQAYALAGRKVVPGGSSEDADKAPQEPRRGTFSKAMDEVLTDDDYVRMTQKLTSIE